jgi:hypothetical protein
MVDEVGTVKGLRGYGFKEEIVHARSAKFAKDISIFCRMSKCGSWKKEMDKDGSVVFRVGWTIR